jgi:uncharacterized protein YndB with AHSA1/START domain
LLEEIVRWLILVLALLIALVIAIFIMGAMLPADHVATGSAIIHQPSEAVWQAINDHANEPKWRAEVKAVERLPDRNGHEVWQEVYKHDRLAFETLEAVPPKKLVRKIVADENAPFSGTWEIELTPVAGGTKVQIIERGSVRNKFFRFVSRFVIGHNTTINNYLKNLVGKFGEPPKV